MHELSIAQSLVAELTAVAERNDAISVRTITIVVGALSGVEKTALEMAFPFAAEKTICNGAELVIKQQPAQILCNNCGKSSNSEDIFYLCPECESDNIEVQAGRELMIESVNLELPDETPEGDPDDV